LPSPHFFGIWQVMIYAPSHPLHPTPTQQAWHPQASLLLAAHLSGAAPAVAQDAGEGHPAGRRQHALERVGDLAPGAERD
jgi:hypothetical protein